MCAPEENAPDEDPRRFATTQWSLVLRAGQIESPQSREALAVLCGNYWYPLYAHVRRKGVKPHDAQDLTQEFFSRLLDGGLLEKADPRRGRFRSFILTALDHFLADSRDKAMSAKRGGGSETVSIDFDLGEQRLALEEKSEDPPDKSFDRRWALALLDSVLKKLEAEYNGAGRGALFAALRETLIGSREAQPYAHLAESLGSSEGAVKVAVHRLRQRYRQILEAEIGNTVGSQEDAADEMRHLLRILSGT